MKKLKLSLDGLQVQSFTTAIGAPNRGTVHGEQQCTCYTCTCPNCETCGASCPNTCGLSCQTCDAFCRTGEQYESCNYASCDFTCATIYCACEP